MLKFASGLMVPTEYEEWAADMNEDGSIRANDAILILRVASGLAAPSVAPLLAYSGGYIGIALAEACSVTARNIAVPVMIDGVAGVFGGDLLISYDKSLLKAVDVALHSGGLMVSNTDVPGIVRISFAAGAGRLHDGAVATINFDTLSDDYTQPILQMVELYDRDALPIDVRVMDIGRTALLPKHTAAFQNYPNPFNPETWIPYQLAEDSEVTVRIYSSTGQLVRTIDLGYRHAGLYTNRDMAARWDGVTDTGESVSSGVYFYTIQAGEYTVTRKMIVSQ